MLLSTKLCELLDALISLLDAKSDYPQCFFKALPTPSPLPSPYSSPSPLPPPRLPLHVIKLYIFAPNLGDAILKRPLKIKTSKLSYSVVINRLQLNPTSSLAFRLPPQKWYVKLETFLWNWHCDMQRNSNYPRAIPILPKISSQKYISTAHLTAVPWNAKPATKFHPKQNSKLARK